ncbi:hypothetical protein HanOQP8_Chr04g0168191 [Helianthus annuus]|nr:hypothetical protein HanHA89_Chr04g0170001 [Helianthus annuus]KAJ0763074.1 hypothetical protein HanOQP8_Chr04g0168191 [Helianthus annuus]
MGNSIYLSGKIGHGVADSPAFPGKMGLPLRQEPGKMEYMICQTSDKNSLNSVMT